VTLSESVTLSRDKGNPKTKRRTKSKPYRIAGAAGNGPAASYFTIINIRRNDMSTKINGEDFRCPDCGCEELVSVETGIVHRYEVTEVELLGEGDYAPECGALLDTDGGDGVSLECAECSREFDGDDLEKLFGKGHQKASEPEEEEEDEGDLKCPECGSRVVRPRSHPDYEDGQWIKCNACDHEGEASEFEPVGEDDEEELTCPECGSHDVRILINDQYEDGQWILCYGCRYEGELGEFEPGQEDEEAGE
jgi:DNA-directed RNA polymerase subunit RPC12/RpoP